MRRPREKAPKKGQERQTSFAFTAPTTAPAPTPPAAPPADSALAPGAGPRVFYEIPGYWALGDEDKAVIDALMVRRAAERDAKKKSPK